ncbi:hypothetical protein [Derxia gummosa]|uniref:DUF721 domain-containing protein n=1 Tax=Derxia gummosa DSM 723 TaxID=1121388 RepID=A0A8B6X882_9BURK|nr:hypothetical protein [Derxia gummosa]
MSRPRALPLTNWLSDIDGLGPMLPSVDRLISLQTAVDRFCRARRMGAVWVRETVGIALKPRLLLVVGMQAQAAKLKNAAPSLLEHLRLEGWNFHDVQVRVKYGVGDPAWGPAPEHPPKPGLKPEQVEGWERLAGELDDGPLRDSVLRLVRHHRGL